MKIVLAQIKYKTGDFKFNCENIIKNICNDCDLIIFPQADIEEIGGKDLVLDRNCRQAQIDFYQNIANKNFKQNILIGDILIRSGQVEITNDGFYEICGQNIFVSDTFVEDIDCDLYVLSKNKYYAMNTMEDFVDSIEVKSNFVYINSIGIADGDVYSGESFIKNANNELVRLLPLCKECVETIDFSKTSVYVEKDIEQELIDITCFALKEYCENILFF